MKVLAIAVCGLALMSSSCATIMTDNQTRITLTSQEPGTVFYVNDRRIRGRGTTASQMIVQREDHIFTGEKRGCENVSEDYHKRVSGWIVGNILFGGIIGLVIDLATNKFWVAQRKRYDVTPDCYDQRRSSL